MSECRICGKTDDLYGISVNGKTYDGICQSCSKTITIYHQTDNQITIDTCEKILKRRASNPEIDEDIKELLNIKREGTVTLSEFTETTTNESHSTPYGGTGKTFWVSLVSTVCKVYMGIMIVAGLIFGSVIGEGILGFVGIMFGAIIGGALFGLVSLMTVSVLMMFVEMAQNIAEINKKL